MGDPVGCSRARKSTRLLAAVSGLVLAGCATGPQQASPVAQAADPPAAHAAGAMHPERTTGRYFRTATSTTPGTVTVEGKTIHYHAVAGVLIVHPPGWNDETPRPEHRRKTVPTEASMFYVAYFKDGAKATDRPITFLYNGGPGSSSVWLHMGAFGPRRVVTADHTHTPPAPYQVVNNDYSLLDASDLVFVDAPGTGFGRLEGKGAKQAFYGADPDVHAFSEFITEFLSKYGRWNSPKYLFGESYGTPRSANLINVLETHDHIDFNGVILLSQILNYDDSTGLVRFNPGIDLPYELALPSYAATAWYHHKLPDSTQPLKPLLEKVERFAMTDYAQALREGSMLSSADRQAIAAKLHEYTGLPVAYILKANLRIDGGQFEHELLSGSDMTTGRLDSRFSGPSLDPLSERAQYDPQSAAISSAYVAAFNAYVRKDLHYGTGLYYRPEIPLFRTWNFAHRQPGMRFDLPRALNVMPDLANAMKQDPKLKVMLNGGYFDLATPFYQGMYEMAHLPMPRSLQGNIEYHYYESGHMVYVHVPALKQLHDNVVAFIDSTDHPSQP
jgi:carboxypeptidase C (cathepsin A)